MGQAEYNKLNYAHHLKNNEEFWIYLFIEIIFAFGI